MKWVFLAILSIILVFTYGYMLADSGMSLVALVIGTVGAGIIGKLAAEAYSKY